MVLKENNVATNNDVVVADKLISKIHTMQWLKHRTIPSKNEEEKMVGKNKNSKVPKAKSHNNTNKSSSANKGAVPFQNAWHKGNNAAGTLFPDAEVDQAEEEEFDKETRKAIEASLISHQAQFQTVIDPAYNNMEETEEGVVEEDYWSSKVHKNLPSPELSKGPSDTNNNSARNQTKDKKIIEHSSSSFTTPRASRVVKENSMTLERATEGSNQPLELSLEKLPPVDKHGRIGGQNERHIFMGRGARRKEQTILEEQQKREKLLSCASYKNTSQNLIRVKNEQETAVKTGGAIARSQYKSVENSRIDKTPKIEPSRDKIIQESEVNSAKKSEKILHLTDFKSRRNTPVIEEDDLPSTSQPEVNKHPTSTRKISAKNDCEGANSNISQKVVIPKSTKTPYHSASGFQSSNSRSLNTNDASLSPEVLYERLAKFDPSLYRLLLEKYMSEVSLSPSSNQTAVYTGREIQGNVLDCENYSTVVDNHENRMKTFSTTQEQATGYQQTLPRNFGHPINSPQHKMMNECPAAIHHDERANNFRPDGSASNFPNNHHNRLAENLPPIALAYFPPVPVYGNIIQEPFPIIVQPQQNYVVQNSINNQQRHPNYPVPYNHGNIHLMRNQRPQYDPRLLEHDSRNFEPRPLYNSRKHDTMIPQPNAPDRSNRERINSSRSSFDSGNNYNFPDRQYGTLRQDTQTPKEPRGTGRL